MDIGKTIRKSREKLGLSQKDLAKALGITPARLSNWELGINRPDADMIGIICKELSISANDLLGLHIVHDPMTSASEMEIVKNSARWTRTEKRQFPSYWIGSIRERALLYRSRSPYPLRKRSAPRGSSTTTACRCLPVRVRSIPATDIMIRWKFLPIGTRSRRTTSCAYRETA